MSNREIWIIAAARTAIGTFGGGLKDVPLADLATTAVRGALERSQVAPDQVSHLVMGNVVPAAAQCIKPGSYPHGGNCAPICANHFENRFNRTTDGRTNQ